MWSPSQLLAFEGGSCLSNGGCAFGLVVARDVPDRSAVYYASTWDVTCGLSRQASSFWEFSSFSRLFQNVAPFRAYFIEDVRREEL